MTVSHPQVGQNSAWKAVFIDAPEAVQDGETLLAQQKGRGMGDILLIALGDEAAGDEAAAIQAARCLSDPDLEIVVAGRPGDGLLALLDTQLPVIIADVVRSGKNPGYIHQMRLCDVIERAGRYPPISAAHAGPAETFRQAEARGLPLPDGLFLGIEGVSFGPSSELSPQVELCFDELVAALRGAIGALRERELDKRRAQ